MNNQNATLNAPSVVDVSSFDFKACVARIAKRKCEGVNIASINLNKSKLVSSVCSEFRSQYPALFDKRDEKGNIIPSSLRLPEEYFNKVVEAVDCFHAEQFDQFNKFSDQVTTYKSRFVHKANTKEVFIRHTLVRDEIVSLETKLTGINAFISATERAIKSINDQKTVLSEKTQERLTKLEKRLVKEETTRNEIKAQLAAVAKTT